MRRHIHWISVLITILVLSNCEKQADLSPERFQLLTDTLAQELDYEPWMDFAYEMSKNFPQESTAGMIMVQGAERALIEQDENRFDQFFDLLKNYPENGVLEITDQIAFGNRLAWTMAEKMLLFNKAPEVIDFSISIFKQHESGLKWRNELGGMIYDTQASVFESINEMDQALEAYGIAIDYFEQPETLLRRGLILENKGELEAALEDYIAALGHAPSQAIIIEKVSNIYTQLHPDDDVDVFISEIQESLHERRKEEVLGEIFSNNAPEFEFTDFDGRVLNNSNMLGKVVFVDFWATWCNPCRRELPEFQKFYNDFKDNPRVVFVAASTDRDREKVKPYIQEMNFTFPVAFAEGNADKFGVEGIPSLFIIGPSGKIRYKIIGFDPDKDFVREMTWRLESLLEN
mgnify:CR=1 FL=1